MRLYHRTPYGSEIVQGGFRDGIGTYMTSEEHTGVFVADVPVDINEGAKGDDLLRIEIDEAVVAPFEWMNEVPDGCATYREWCVPASVLNAHGTVRLLTFDEEEELALQDFQESIATSWAERRAWLIADRRRNRQAAGEHHGGRSGAAVRRRPPPPSVRPARRWPPGPP
jgi:hypothetical protein